MVTSDFDGVQFDPVAAQQAAAQLDGLAGRLAGDLQDERPRLTAASAGSDEVSVRAAQTLDSVAESFQRSADAGVLEVRKLAATLRVQSGRFGQAESDNAADFGGVATA
ncbi:PE family protein [Nocardia sp. alder85J]|uniref:PE family protein n=1 Tax=Nocardia sp. alder85J TaxID=2862949 RepID=UPI001CD3D6FE|nr:PE family protein [Nocardia sp. alder85J]MCX4093032.1 PE family protein [Nocardia sp. alder85J]